MKAASPPPSVPAASLDLPLELPATGTQSTRVFAALRGAILDRRLAPGLRLPSSRALASQLGLRRNAVVVAFEHLLSDGLVEARTGAGTFVAPQLPDFAAKAPRGANNAGPRLHTGTHPPGISPSGIPESGAAGEPPLPAARHAPFAIGHTSPDPTLLRQFGRCLRDVLLRADPAHFSYGDPRGSAALRSAVATHLAATRGIRCDPAQVLLTNGTQQGLRLVAEVLLRPGDAVWMEDPGYPTAWRVLRTLGAQLVPVPVDAAGLVVSTGRDAAPAARLAYVTPSHQFPTGVTMSMARRAELLAWARTQDGWIVEDDYDSEFRYAGPPLTALAGLDSNAANPSGSSLAGSNRVIYLGTFSKTLFPGLRAGYAVLPPALLSPVIAARAAADRFPCTLTNEALAELLHSGAFAAHLRRMRNRYRRARDLVAATLQQHAGGRLRVAVPDQGLHLLAMLAPDLPAQAASAIRAAAGIEARLLSESRLTPGGAEGFILGFSGYDLTALRDAAERLGRTAQRWRPAA